MGNGGLMDLTADIGLERVQRAIALMMAQNINNALTVQENLWVARDATYFSALGRTNPGWTLERISPDNVHSGIIPSLIDSPPEDFPNICVIAYAANPIGTSDWGERFLQAVEVQFMVKSLTDEEEVNARIQRTLEAAHSLLLSDEARRIPDAEGDIVPQISSMPAVEISGVFVRHLSTDPNAKSFYQHGTLTYRVEKFATY
jgi:hypothetical protein